MIKQERAARTRQALIAAAAEVFAREGYAATSLGAVSGRAAVSAGALHFHFANKKALAQAIEDEAVGALRRIVEQVCADVADPLQQLVDSVHLLVEQLGLDPVLRAGFRLGEDAEAGPDGALRREWRGWAEDALGRVERAGDLTPGLSVRDAVTAVLVATAGFQVLGGEDGRWLAPRRVTGFWAVLAPGLATPQALARLRLGPPGPTE